MPVSLRCWGCVRLAGVTAAFAYYTVWVFATVRQLRTVQHELFSGVALSIDAQHTPCILTNEYAARQPFIEEGSALQRLFPPVHIAIGVPTAAGVLLLGATLLHIGWTLVASQLDRRCPLPTWHPCALPAPPSVPSIPAPISVRTAARRSRKVMVASPLDDAGLGTSRALHILTSDPALGTCLMAQRRSTGSSR